MDNLDAIIEQLDFLYSISPIDIPNIIDLRNTNLISIPEYIWKQRNFTSLSLVDNNLIEIPEQIGSLFNLTELWLGGNALSSLPEQIGRLYRLTELGLDRNNLSELPKSIDFLVNLKYLNLSQNKFTRLPSRIGNLVTLNYLDISDNSLSILPDFLTNLPNLQMIKLDGNPISDLSVLAKIPNLCYAEFQKMALTRRYFTKLTDWKPEWIIDEKDVERQGLTAYFARLLRAKILKSTAIVPWEEPSTNSARIEIDSTSIGKILSLKSDSDRPENRSTAMAEDIRGDPDR
jgi:Leucine-rich repeat (LRR) protein